MTLQSYSPIIDHASRFFAAPAVEPRRVFHGRGHLHPGLEHINIDWYPPVLLLITYQPIEDTTQQWLIEQIVATDVTRQLQSIILQQRDKRNAPSRRLWGIDPGVIRVEEDGLSFEIQPGIHQNAGLFLDTRLLRSWLKNHSEGNNVLNLFAYTCSLSVAALAGGARQVVNLDMSRNALDWGKRNHALNHMDERRVRYIPHNVFKSWGKVRQFGRYDLLIIDPPSHQRGSFDVERNYKTILRRLKGLAAPAADLVATVNSPWVNFDFLPNQLARSAPEFRLIGQLPVSPEFTDLYPERALKIYHFKRRG